MKNFHENYSAKTGTSIATTDTRFAWAMAMIFEGRNNAKAKRFAKYGMRQLTKEDSFFGRADFERIINTVIE